MYAKWLVLNIVNLFMKFCIAWPLTPAIVLFADEDGYLPLFLEWFETPDNDLDGDEGWKAGSRPFKTEKNRFQRYWNRCSWLWRNTLYGFNANVLAVEYYPTDVFVKHGAEHVSNGPDAAAGWQMCYLIRNERKVAWMFYYVKQLSFWPRKCIRILLGYKLFQHKERQFGLCHLAFSPGIIHYIE